MCPLLNDYDRKARMFLKSPDPLEDQCRRESQQGELATGGLFHCFFLPVNPISRNCCIIRKSLFLMYP